MIHQMTMQVIQNFIKVQFLILTYCGILWYIFDMDMCPFRSTEKCVCKKNNNNCLQAS